MSVGEVSIGEESVGEMPVGDVSENCFQTPENLLKILEKG